MGGIQIVRSVAEVPAFPTSSSCGAEGAAPFGCERAGEGFEEYLVDVTPAPVLARLETFNNRMIRRMEMLSRVLVL